MGQPTSGKANGPATYLIGGYMFIGGMFGLASVLSSQAWAFLHDTRPWYNKLLSGGIDATSVMVSVIAWPRYIYVWITQGYDAFLRDLFSAWY